MQSFAARSLVLLVFFSAACTSRHGDPIPLPDAASDAGADALVEPESGVDAGGDAVVDDAPNDAAMDPAPIVRALLDVICDARLHASCTSPWDCGCGDLGPRPDAVACAADYVPSCRSYEGDGLETSVAADRVRLDLASLDLCQRTLEGAWASCVPLAFSEVAACRHARVSLVPIGAACTGPSLCADGMGVCDEGGTCARAPARDGRCDTNECGAGLSCFESLCTLPRAAGFSCVDHEDCASPLLCLGGLCGAVSAVGETCAMSGTCAVGARCSGGSCVLRAAGACADDAECGNLTHCFRPGARRCEALGAPGSACDDDASCLDGLACDPDANVCRALGTSGQACFERCASGLFCDFGACAPQVAAGSDCPFDSSACSAGLACVAGTCGDAPAVATRCADDRMCASGLACIDESGGPTCEVPHPLGGSCGVSTDCASGLACIVGTCSTPVAPGGECFVSEDCEVGLACAYDEVAGVSRCGTSPGPTEICADVCASGARCVDVLDPGSCVPDLCASLAL